MISIIDYGMGNLGSVKKKLNGIGCESVISSDFKEIRKSEKIILPGVGHFAKAVKEIKKRGLWEFISEEVLMSKKPILGICLGMQLMADYSEEGNEEGFGWLNAKVIKFQIEDIKKYKVPQIGWNSLIQKKSNNLLRGTNEESQFYFVHSYHFVCNDELDILTTTYYEHEFVSAVQKNNIFGTQFHPEKSHQAGEVLLKNFLFI